MNGKQIALNIFAGALSGLLCGLGGAVKDCTHADEKFSPLIFLRSPIIGTLWGAVSIFITTDFFLSFTFSGYAERCTVEFWKIVRQKVPAKHEWKRKGEKEWKFF